MGAFARAQEILKGARDREGSIPSTLIMWASAYEQILEGEHAGKQVDVAEMLTPNANAGRYLDKMEANTLSGWKKETDGRYSKQFVQARQRQLAMTTLGLLSQYEGYPPFAADQKLHMEDITGPVLAGEQTHTYKLWSDADFLEPILKQENMLDTQQRREGM